MKRAILIITAILLSINVLKAQNSISGTLVDGNTNESLAFVNVGLIRAADTVYISGTASNEKGFFKIENIRNGQYILQITADIKYSDLSVSMTSDSPVVLIDCSYSDAVVHLNESASFKYSFDTSYCDITFKGFFDTETISRTGSRGDGQQGRIEVDARYGDVKFYKNK